MVEELSEWLVHEIIQKFIMIQELVANKKLVQVVGSGDVKEQIHVRIFGHQMIETLDPKKCQDKVRDKVKVQS